MKKKTKRKINVASAKAKGRRLQQYVRDAILSRWTDLEPDDVKSTPMGVGGEDVQLSPLARRQVKLSIECKARKTIPVYGWYSQAKENAPKGTEPILVIKQDRKKPLAVVDFDHYLNLKEKQE